MKNSCVQWVAKELAIVLPYLSDSEFQCNLRQGWIHDFNGNCNHYSWKKLNNWLQCRSSSRCCNQSIHVYQNCLEHSQKHVCDGANDHYNQGGLKNGRRTLKIFWEDWYARAISRFVYNKLRFCFKLDGSGNCIIRRTWLHCIWFEKKFKLNQVIPHFTRSVNCRLCLPHFNEYQPCLWIFSNE